MSLRVQTDSGKIVGLDDFEFKADHINLLLNMQRLTPNILLRSHDDQGRLHELPAFRYVGDRDLIAILNANAA